MNISFAHPINSSYNIEIHFNWENPIVEIEVLRNQNFLKYLERSMVSSNLKQSLYKDKKILSSNIAWESK